MEGLNLPAILNVGAVGAVLAWFLFRTEGRLDRIEHALDRMVRAQMVLVLSSRDVDAGVRHEARTIIDEIEREGH